MKSNSIKKLWAQFTDDFSPKRKYRLRTGQIESDLLDESCAIDINERWDNFKKSNSYSTISKPINICKADKNADRLLQIHNMQHNMRNEMENTRKKYETNFGYGIYKGDQGFADIIKIMDTKEALKMKNFGQGNLSISKKNENQSETMVKRRELREFAKNGLGVTEMVDKLKKDNFFKN